MDRGFDNSPKENPQSLDLPMDPNNVLSKEERTGRVPTKRSDYLSKSEAKTQGVDVGPLGAFVDRYGSVIAFSDVPEIVAKGVALATEIAPQRVLNKLGISESPSPPQIILVGGPLRLRSGQKIPAAVDMNGNVPTAIRMSLENIRISFGLTHNKTSELDPIICFATAVHEISDWIQVTHSGHNSLFGLHDTDEHARAKRHSGSKSERFSNNMATELTEEMFGVTVTFGENDQTIYTPEPPDSI